MPATDRPAESTAPAPYVGRFAPSPSGRLHLGSLVCALASYLEARSQRGEWLVRMEDIDPPREEPGAQDAILRTLEAHGLHWDREVLRQSTRHQAYRELLAELQNAQLCYRCSCNRRRLQSLAGPYDGHCRRHPPAPDEAAAMRLKVSDLPNGFHCTSCIHFDDGIHGPCTEDLYNTCGDFVIHRKDGLFAYQLAVVADDIFQGITHIVRGSDLLDTTARQVYLFHLLGEQAPHYSHIPVLVDQQQQKLSKQNRAPAVDDASAGANLWHACHCLGLSPPTALRSASPPALLEWALEHWSLQSVPRAHSLLAPETHSDT
jgi:glutamyl-Q tRNA(Asp) synthetase